MDILLPVLLPAFWGEFLPNLVLASIESCFSQYDTSDYVPCGCKRDSVGTSLGKAYRLWCHKTWIWIPALLLMEFNFLFGKRRAINISWVGRSIKWDFVYRTSCRRSGLKQWHLRPSLLSKHDLSFFMTLRKSGWIFATVLLFLYTLLILQ